MKPFAFVFPGQGSQAVGMLDAWGDHPAVVSTLQEASDALGEDMARLVREGPKEALALTTNTQPVMLVAGVAAYRAWRSEGGDVKAFPAQAPHRVPSEFQDVRTAFASGRATASDVNDGGPHRSDGRGESRVQGTEDIEGRLRHLKHSFSFGACAFEASENIAC